MAKILTTYYLDRFIIPCVLDATPFFHDAAIDRAKRTGRSP
jgi:hypothetical protein